MRDSGPVLLSIADGIATVTLNRPQRLNAFDAKMHDALRGVLDTVKRDADVRAMILTGEGRAFCAGQDLVERAETFHAGGVPDLTESLEVNYNPLVRCIAALDIPVIAAVNGIAAGAGAALAIGCDIVLAGESAKFQFAFSKVGLGPDSGTSWLLPRLVGQMRALALSLTAETLDATTAERMGLVWRVLSDADLQAEVKRLAFTFMARSRPALAAIKHGLRDAAERTLDEALDAEREAQGTLGHTVEYRTAVLHFAGNCVAERSDGVREGRA